jgi:hypothetical protein
VIATLNTLERETSGAGLLAGLTRIKKARTVHASIAFWLAEARKRGVSFAEVFFNFLIFKNLKIFFINFFIV